MAKIMVVDDEPDLREMLDLMLNKEGFETETAENGSDFLDKLDEFNPDIVTLDIMMPGLTTSEILKKLKGKKSNPKIILLTVVRYSDEEKNKIKAEVKILGLPDKFVEHGSLSILKKKYSLTKEGILEAIKEI